MFYNYFSIAYNRLIYRPLIKLKLAKCGTDFKLGFSSNILNPQFFSIGDHFYCGPYAYFGTNRQNPVQIGDYVMFGPNCTIQGGNHDISFKGFMYLNRDIDHMKSSIIIENGAWIGSNSVIISGAKIGEGSVIGALSLVNHAIPPFVVAAGIPVKVIKPRFSTLNELEETLQVTQSKYSLEEIIKIHEKYGFEYI